MEYRTLGLDEVIQGGDEFFCGRWRPVIVSIGYMVRHAKMHIINTEYRRPVSSEYRELEKGEVVKAGDEFLAGSVKWLSVRHDIGNVVGRDVPDRKYRRKINDTSGAVVATAAEMMFRHTTSNQGKSTSTIPIDICVLCKANPLRNCPPCREISKVVSAKPTR